MGILIGIALIVVIYLALPAARRPDRRHHVAVVLGMLLAVIASLVVGNYRGCRSCGKSGRSGALIGSPLRLVCHHASVGAAPAPKIAARHMRMSGSVVPRNCVCGVLVGKSPDAGSTAAEASATG